MTTRYLPELTAHVAAYANLPQKVFGTAHFDESITGNQERPSRKLYQVYYELLDDPNTKRMLFDSRQALLFADLVDVDERVPMNIQTKLHAPFDQFYLEFTDPIELPHNEPGKRDLLRGVLFVRDVFQCEIPYYPTTDGQDAIIRNLAPELRESKATKMNVPLSQLIFFLTSRDEDPSKGRIYVDRAFKYSLDLGYSFVTVRSAVASGSVGPGLDPESGEHTFDSDEHYIPAKGSLLWDDDTRVFGWWEEWCDMAGALFSYILTYMMAKSIIITEEPLSRQVRRRHERKGTLPKPWHIVKVEPKFAAAHGMAEGGGTHVSFRFDVIGHLRFGKHKRGDGSYSHTIEWVPPHQRGLANTVYIPKTYKVERGKVVASKMKEYWG